MLRLATYRTVKKRGLFQITFWLRHYLYNESFINIPRRDVLFSVTSHPRNLLYQTLLFDYRKILCLLFYEKNERRYSFEKPESS
jgi:hypothetical protein